MADHPELFQSYGRFRQGTPEFRLHSGDKVDVLFAKAGVPLAVEVKAAGAPAGDIVRGIFQCVKYRAVLRAMRLVEGKPPNAHALLVVERRLEGELLRLAKRLGVKWLRVSRS